MARTTFSGPVVSNAGFTATAILFADLPPAAANAGRIYFVSNARKEGEGLGAGTGTLVFSDGTNWIRVDDGANAAA